uniref:SNTX MACPF/CDC-like domain-containing protein n=1 Tax=Acrobeloides nanus TaxID=290746 RepID=A0A914CPR5_9BILA
MDSTLVIPSLGRTASLGDVYDARRDEFVHGVSILQKSVPPELINTINNPTTEHDMFVTDKLSTKLTKLDLSAELKLSVLNGLVEVKGSASFINENKSTSHAFQYNLIQKITTLDEKINIQHEGITKCLTKNVGDDGTHVVVGITYGANTVITLTNENEEKEDLLHLEGEFQTQKVASLNKRS